MKLALVGGAPTWIHAPYADRDWTIWAHASCQPLHLPRVDRWFDLHTVDVWRQGKTWYRPDASEPLTYVDWLASRDVPITMQESYPLIPTAERYPLRDIVETFNIVPAEWDLSQKDAEWWELVKDRGEFTCTVSYMIALALYMGVECIDLFGIDFAGNDILKIERTVQRPGAKYWVGIARGMGVPVTVAPGSRFEYQQFLYGYQRTPEPALLTV